MLVSPRLLKAGKFYEFIGRTATDQLIYGVMSADGQIYLFERADIEELLNSAYPTRDKYGWYFNATCDRYIAEFHFDDTISVNPSFVDKHFVERLYS